MQLRTNKATDKAKPMMMLSGPLLLLRQCEDGWITPPDANGNVCVARGQTQKFIDRANDRPTTQDAKPPAGAAPPPIA